MRVTVVLEARYDRSPDGSVWAAGGSHRFFHRYLEVFDEVDVVARMRDVVEPPPGCGQVSGPGVVFKAVPYFVGPWQYVRRALPVRRAVQRAISPRGAVILRIGSLLAIQAEPTLQGRGQPYGVEVVGDPEAVFSPGVTRHPLRPLLRWWFTRRTAEQCARAAGASYVTERYLQAKYPCAAYNIGVSDVDLQGETRSDREDSYSTHFTSASLEASDFAERKIRGEHPQVPLILTIGSLAQRYKGVDVLLDAIRMCKDAGVPTRLAVVGDGRYRASLEARASRLGLSATVSFLGTCPPGPALRAELDKADLFVLASRTEGLPRALLEAMARGVPCLGTAVGGIPELLDESELVPPDDPRALADRIASVLSDPKRRAYLSARNVAKAEEYREDALRPRWTAFYRHIERVTNAWLALGPR